MLNKELMEYLKTCDPEAEVFTFIDHPQKVDPWGYREEGLCPDCSSFI